MHGGLRYLQQREFRLVYEALYERQRCARERPAPRAHPAVPRPAADERRRDRPTAGARCSAARSGCTTSPAALRIGKRHHRIDVDTALAHMPTLPRDRLAGAYVYYDAQADDARLTPHHRPHRRASNGAVVANHTAVRGLVKDGDRVVGARRAKPTAHEIEVRARRRRERGRRLGRRRARARRGHRTRRRSVRPRASTSPCRGRRSATTSPPSSRCPATSASVFVVPWGDTTYVGTTDTDYDGPLDDPPCTPDDVDYLLGAHQRRQRGAAHRRRRRRHVGRACDRSCAPRRSSRTADLSRRHTVRASPSGVVTVTGGKLTTYRRMAADTVDAGRRSVLGRSRGPVAHEAPARCSAARASTRAGGRARAEHPRAPRRPLRHRSRGRARAHRRPTPTSREPLVPGLPYLARRGRLRGRATRWRARSTTCSSRRTRAAPAGTRRLGRRRPRRSPSCSHPSSGWSDAERDAQVAAYRASTVDRRARRRRSRELGAVHEPPVREPDRGARVAEVPDALPRPVWRGECAVRACTDDAGGRRRGQPRLVAAGDDLGARRHAVTARPRPWSTPASTSTRSRRCCASVQRRPRAASPRRRTQRRVRRERAGARRRRARPLRARRHRRRRRHVAGARRARRHVRHAARGRRCAPITA